MSPVEITILDTVLELILTKTPEELNAFGLVCPCRDCHTDAKAIAYYESVVFPEGYVAYVFSRAEKLGLILHESTIAKAERHSEYAEKLSYERQPQVQT